MHDKNGTPLKQGDIVSVLCKVVNTTEGTEYCNMTVETVEPMYPGEYKTSVTLNTRQVVLQERPKDPEPA